ncbi:hypothetical protein GALMADRAFT_1326624 [Galerina marginata CBS 339.88]|uniref:Peptidase metallopeptidase domain-containing protein n=1 Tax=Galerina marginata (strain CBS 339.88) TaxID=685588 RepID=A0A067TFH5_GALM3|nr:hypothetical protein GALMADRAFT_1326624 [Galerina marginata CBS 339.88]
MASTPDSTQTLNLVGVDIPYVRRWGFDRNPVQIASLSGLWQPVFDLPALADDDAVNAAPVANPRHEITFGYFAPLRDGVRDPAHAGTADQHAKVEATIKEWERYAHVSFVSADVAVATMRISFVPADGNWSMVGPQHVAMAGADEETMNLGGLNAAGALASDYERHIILHEFGHTLGLLHEHQSPAREGVITLDASCARYIQRGWSPEMVQSQIASQDGLNRITSYSELDLDSVMTYATSGDENVYAELNHELSILDKAFMVINYPRIGERINFIYPREGGELVERNDSAWTMEHALNMVGLTHGEWPDIRAEILNRYADLNEAHTNEIREIFGAWTKARREEERAARVADAQPAQAAEAHNNVDN